MLDCGIIDDMATVSISKSEYVRLKKIDKKFRDFLAYAEHFLEIREARNDVKRKKVIAQEKLFAKLGF